MHIADIMRQDSPTFSFEFFPPKTPAAAETLYQTIRDLESYMPQFVSVTYGAGGSTRELTHNLVERIQHTTKLDPIPHLTCVCHNEKEVEDILIRYAKAAIGNVLDCRLSISNQNVFDLLFIMANAGQMRDWIQFCSVLNALDEIVS